MEELRRSYFGPKFPKVNGFYNANLATWVGLNESEETEVKKDIEWLKAEVKSLFDKAYELGKMEYHESEESTHRINSLIDQLDEPEVLSQDWINKHAKAVTYDGIPDQTEIVYVDELESLLVPKQELPVIPNFVAKYLEIAKSGVSLMRVLEIANRRDELPKWEKEYDWISANDETFARAWLDGYEIEKEKLYHIKFSENQYARKFDGTKIDSILINDKAIAGKFTKKEIEKMNPALMAFAVEVAE